jgi:hypothetical protein
VKEADDVVATSTDISAEAKLETSNDNIKKSSLQEQLTIEAPVMKNDVSSTTNETVSTVTVNEFRVYTKEFLLRYVADIYLSEFEHMTLPRNEDALHDLIHCFILLMGFCNTD